MNHPQYRVNWAGSICFTQVKICNAKKKGQSKDLSAHQIHTGLETLSRNKHPKFGKGWKEGKGTGHPR